VVEGWRCLGSRSGVGVNQRWWRTRNADAQEWTGGGGRGRGIGASKSSKVGLLTRGVERSGIDCRTVGAVRRGDVHDRQARPKPAVTTKMATTTCRSVVGLTRSGAETRCRWAGLSMHWIGFRGEGTAKLDQARQDKEQDPKFQGWTRWTGPAGSRKWGQ
jgi:hypothetical protein